MASLFRRRGRIGVIELFGMIGPVVRSSVHYQLLDRLERNPRIRAVVLMLISGFYVFHALLHVWDTARGFLGPEHWMMDAGGVYLPAVLLLVVTAWAKRIEPQ